MPLQASQRSRSAPHPLSSLAFSASDDTASPPLPSPHIIRKSHAEVEDPFNMGGFFPRSQSYLNLKTHQEDWQWLQKQDDDDNEEEDDEQVDPRHAQSSPSVTPATHSLSLPATPFTGSRTLFEVEDSYTRDIKDADAFGVLSVTRASITRTASAPLTLFPVDLAYNHDHLIHSYDALHSDMCQRRKATIDGSQAGSGKATPMFLFSPLEELELDFSVDDDQKPEKDGGDDGDVPGDDAHWTSHLYRGMHRWWKQAPAS